MNEPLLLMTNMPDEASAAALATHLVEHHLAACVSQLSPCRSVYRWQGQIETTNEFPVLIKTSRARYAEVETAVRDLHPYDVPELIAMPIVAGLPAYLDWLLEETK